MVYQVSKPNNLYKRGFYIYHTYFKLKPKQSIKRKKCLHHITLLQINQFSDSYLYLLHTEQQNVYKL